MSYPGERVVGMGAAKRFLAKLWSDENGISSVEYAVKRINMLVAIAWAAMRHYSNMLEYDAAKQISRQTSCWCCRMALTAPSQQPRCHHRRGLRQELLELLDLGLAQRVAAGHGIGEMGSGQPQQLRGLGLRDPGGLVEVAAHKTSHQLVRLTSLS